MERQPGQEDVEMKDVDGVRDLTGIYPRVHDGVQKLVEITEMRTAVVEAREGEEVKKHDRSENDHDNSREGPGAAIVLSSSQVATAKKNERPPVDDCCAICFGDFVLPCKTNCGHWFCARCILQLWHYKPALQLCNCPICCCVITKLSPEASSLASRDGDVAQVLKDIQRYNHLSVHGWEGVFLKIRALPLLIQRMFRDLIQPGMLGLIIDILRGVGSLLGLLCWICNLGPDPMDWLIYFPRMAGRWATAIVIIFFLVYICQILMRRIQARRLVGVQLEQM
ncbi:uncharacterized protein [Coffea arabica]|uniref:RING-type domain-containing protein n=1 Tax=Coffea arabica TaxID=13443 RepID=A0A6P6WHG0_COFAR